MLVCADDPMMFLVADGLMMLYCIAGELTMLRCVAGDLMLIYTADDTMLICAVDG